MLLLCCALTYCSAPRKHLFSVVTLFFAHARAEEGKKYWTLSAVKVKACAVVKGWENNAKISNRWDVK